MSRGRRSQRSRRWFLRVMAGTAAGSMLVGPQPPVLSGNAGARAVGAAFLRAFPAQADVTMLTRAVGRRATVLRRIRRDFEKGRVLVLEGWVLSETEARLCALVALESGSRLG